MATTIDRKCASIVTISGDSIPWVEEIRYLGIFIVKFRYFKCSLDHAKRSFYRTANAIFGKIGHSFGGSNTRTY
jgi:hypothetical protein